uniref:Uncharacterized protein n=1 Tax=Lepeophtheirus salmonis TaxID=72036 RepID=A0A0K2V7Z7_LEPSM
MSEGITKNTEHKIRYNCREFPQDFKIRFF